jgi:hypothetical protein
MVTVQGQAARCPVSNRTGTKPQTSGFEAMWSVLVMSVWLTQ